MIIDKETNKVFFSALLNKWHPIETKKITDILDKYSIAYNFLKATKDIWCRDYMSIQVNNEKYVQFKYEPRYLENSRNLRSDPIAICKQNNITVFNSRLNIDGGNIIKSKNKVILTDRIFAENKNLSQKSILDKLETLLEAQIIIIPQIEDDMTGHADGMLRFIDDNTILINELQNEYKSYKKAVINIMKKNNFTFIELPWFEDHESKDSAIGIYINFLEIKDLIIFPIFEVPSNMDNEALAVIKDIYTNSKIEIININDIAAKGGLMNCITWNIKE